MSRWNNRDPNRSKDMRIVVQRVKQARVEVEGNTVGQIEHGLLVYLGVGRDDSEEDARYMAEKVVNLRIFQDENDKMNRSIQDVGGSVLLISQFTLYGDCRKGRRPGFDAAGEPARAESLYERVKQLIAENDVPVATGIFAASMLVSSVNDGPVTFLLDSQRLF